MPQYDDLKKCLNDLLLKEKNGGAQLSSALLRILSLSDQPKGESMPVAGSRGPLCGNGITGPGSNGERQVNDEAQDTAPGVFPHITQSETTVARSGTFVVFGFNDTNDDANNNGTGYGFSSDSGVTWSDCGNLPRGTLLFADLGDPVLASDSKGIFYFARLGVLPAPTFQSIIAVSTGQVVPVINQLNFSDPFIAGVGEFPGNLNSIFEDKEWIAVGTDKSNPGTEALYVTWTDFTDLTNLFTDTIRFSKFTTGVSPTQLIASKTIVPSPFTDFNPVQGSFPVVDSQGNIFVFYENFTPVLGTTTLSIRMVRSTDGGSTFSDPIIVASPVGIAANVFLVPPFGTPAISLNPPTNSIAIRTQEFPHAAVGPDGTLYVVWNEGIGFPATDINIWLAFSTNGGDTWNKVQVTTTNTYEFFPSVIVQCGEAHVQYSRFNDPQDVGGVGNGTFALFKKSFSITDGLSAETMVSTVFSPVPVTNPNFDTGLAPGYMGDYNQIIKGPDIALYHAWGDNRNTTMGVPNPDVFFIQTMATCPTTTTTTSTTTTTTTTSTTSTTATTTVSRQQIVNLLQASIAFEELGLAHVINAEAEKIQSVLGTLAGQTVKNPTIDELEKIDGSVGRILQDVIKKEMLLQFKLEDVLTIPASTTPTTTKQT